MAVAPPATPVATSVRIDPTLDSACTRAAHIASEALHIPLTRDTAVTFKAPREAPAPWHGCRFTASSPAAAAPYTKPGAPDGLLQRAYLAAGWTQDFDYDVDGADGAELGMRRGDVFCHLAIAYPPEEVRDDASVASPAQAAVSGPPYTFVLRCARRLASAPR